MADDNDTVPKVGVLGGSVGMVVALVVVLRYTPELPEALQLAVWVTIAVSVLVAVVMVADLLYPWVSARGRVRRDYGRQGFASWIRLYRAKVTTASVLRDAGVSRRAVAASSPPARRESAQLQATFVGRTAVGPVLPLRTWCPHEQVILGVGPPRCGKTTWLSSKVIDHPGPVLSTSTKIDVYQDTAADRARQGPVLVFNPENLGAVLSTFAWSPLTGCADPDMAAERAAHLVAGAHPGEGVTNGDFFEAQATKVLKVLLFAAAIANKDMSCVAQWANRPTDREVREILDDHRSRVPTGWEDELAQIQDSRADRSSAAVYMTLSLATGFMANPTVARACRPDPRQGTFDVASFLASGATLYIIGHHRKDNPIAPLITALTGYVFETCKRIAQDQGGKLATAPLFALDEVALITPLPLDEWNADAGGRGIHLIEMVQSPSQLYKRYGERGGQTIVNTAGAYLVWGGLKIDADVEAISKLCGEYERTVVTTNSGGHDGGRRSYSKQWRRIVPFERVRLLPKWHILVIYANAPVSIVSYIPVFRRRDTVAALARDGAPRRRGATSQTVQPDVGGPAPSTG